MKKYARSICRLLKAVAKDPRMFAHAVNTAPDTYSTRSFAKTYTETILEVVGHVSSSTNPLWEYFQAHKEGRGIFKWEHYFEIYHRHFARFVGRKVNVLEIGVYSGGSLEM